MDSIRSWAESSPSPNGEFTVTAFFDNYHPLHRRFGLRDLGDFLANISSVAVVSANRFEIEFSAANRNGNRFVAVVSIY
jgi:hypothetical protein